MKGPPAKGGPLHEIRGSLATLSIRAATMESGSLHFCAETVVHLPIRPDQLTSLWLEQVLDPEA
jgi:hypothetical protein